MPLQLWNEPNNRSHWAHELDREWQQFAAMVRLAGQAVAAERPGLRRVLGGNSPIDPDFLRLLQSRGVLERVDAVAVHGFPLDWNLWQIGEWPERLCEVQAVTLLPVWVTEVGVSSFGAEEVQEWGSPARPRWSRGGVRPRKRVAPDARPLFPRRKLIYRMRPLITAWSHRVFWLARVTRCPGV